MLILAAHVVPLGEKAKILGMAKREEYEKGTTIKVMTEKGEIVAEAKTLYAGQIVSHKTQNPKWLITMENGASTLGHGHILIDLEKMEFHEEITTPFHPALETPMATKPPLFKKEYRILKKFGELWSKKTIPQIRDMLIPIVEVAGEGYAEKARITDDEKTLTTNVQGETRIYSLKTRELEEIITWDQIIWALNRTKPPRKMMKMLMKSNFTGLVDPKRKNIVWYVAKWSLGFPAVPIAIFIYDRDEREIIAGPENPIEIILREGIDEDYTIAKHVNRQRLYDPEYLRVERYRLRGHIHATYPQAAIYTLTTNMDGIAPKDELERTRLGLPASPPTDMWTILLKLDENLNVKSYISRFPLDGREYVFSITDIADPNCKIYCWENDITVAARFTSFDLKRVIDDIYTTSHFCGIVRLTTDLKPVDAFNTTPLEKWFIDEYGFREKKYVKIGGEKKQAYMIYANETDASLSPDRSRIFIPIRIECVETYAPELIYGVYLFITDWKANKIREVWRHEEKGRKLEWSPHSDWTAWI